MGFRVFWHVFSRAFAKPSLMDKYEIKRLAIEFENLATARAHCDDDARILLNALDDILDDAKNGRILKPIENIPCRYMVYEIRYEHMNSELCNAYSTLAMILGFEDHEDYLSTLDMVNSIGAKVSDVSNTEPDTRGKTG